MKKDSFGHWAWHLSSFPLFVLKYVWGDEVHIHGFKSRFCYFTSTSYQKNNKIAKSKILSTKSTFSSAEDTVTLRSVWMTCNCAAVFSSCCSANLLDASDFRAAFSSWQFVRKSWPRSGWKCGNWRGNIQSQGLSDRVPLNLWLYQKKVQYFLDWMVILWV